jgi:hypothetical protein
MVCDAPRQLIEPAVGRLPRPAAGLTAGGDRLRGGLPDGHNQHLRASQADGRSVSGDVVNPQRPMTLTVDVASRVTVVRIRHNSSDPRRER